MRTLLPLLPAGLLAACTGGLVDQGGVNGDLDGFNGVRMSDYFPQDGLRDAEYINDDAAVPFTLLVEKVSPVENVDGVEVVTWEWSRDDTGARLGAVKWSSVSGDGIHIHAWADGEGAFTTFDTPVAFTDDDDFMETGDSVATTTDGLTFSATFVGLEDCPVAWGMAWEDCAHVRLDDGDGDDATGPLFAGDYWLAPSWGPAWMAVTGYAKWDLAHYDWAAG